MRDGLSPTSDLQLTAILWLTNYIADYANHQPNSDSSHLSVPTRGELWKEYQAHEILTKHLLIYGNGFGRAILKLSLILKKVYIKSLQIKTGKSKWKTFMFCQIILPSSVDIPNKRRRSIAGYLKPSKGVIYFHLVVRPLIAHTALIL